MPSEPASHTGDREHRGRARRARRRINTVAEISAGGLVLDRLAIDACAALIARRDRHGALDWVLPKGHVEPGETIEIGAIREVAEETGLHAAVIAPLGTIDYHFVARGRRVHKVVHHFLLSAVGGRLGTDDPEVAKVEWVPLVEVPVRLRYASERGLLDNLPRLLADRAVDDR